MRDIDTRPASSAAAVTPSDSTPLAYNCRSLYIGVGGNAAVRFPGEPAV